MKSGSQAAARATEKFVENRRQPRFKLQVPIRISGRSCGLLKGETVDISESGISVMLKIEVLIGELVELEFSLPSGEVKVFALVRQRNAFRYGMQFVQSDSAKAIIEATCRRMSVEQALLGDL